MRKPLGLLIGTLAALALVGCTEPPASAPPPVSSAPPSPSTSATATPAKVDLPTVEAIQGALDVAADDTREPIARFGVVIRDGHTEQLRNESTVVGSGPAVLRVACSSATGAPVTVHFAADDGVSFEVEAQCGEALEDGFAIATTQGDPFDLTTAYTISVTPTVEAAIGVGVVQG